MAARWAGVAGLLFLLPLLPSASSMKLKLYEDVYPTRHFYVTLNIGHPKKPYFLDIDTGSSLTWLECNIDGPCTKCYKVPHDLYKPKKLIHCEHPLCNAVHEDLGSKNEHCPPKTQCDYLITYLDGWRSVGVLVADKFTFNTATDPAIAFGCGYDQDGNPQKETVVDGILGLGRGKADLVSQLKQHKIITKNVIGHCLGRRGGYLLIGEEDVLSLPLNWMPMAQSKRIQNHYSPGPATLHLGTQLIGAKMDVILDSGSTYTYLPEKIHNQLVSMLKASLSNSLKEVPDDDPELTLCWDRPGKFTSLDDIKKEFKSVVSLMFAQGVSMMIPPENYLIISKNQNACLGIFGMKKLDIYLIGDITMQDQLVIYDNENGRLAWKQSSCDNMPKSSHVIVSHV